MTELRWSNLVRMFFDQAARFGDRPFLWAKQDGLYRSLSWREAATRAVAFARGLRAAGIVPGDRVMLVAENRPEWLIADLAIMAAGGITVPAYTTNTEAEHFHVLENSGAKGVVVSTRKLAEVVLSAALRSADAAFVVAIDPPPIRQQAGINVLRWDRVLANGSHDSTDVVAAATNLARTDTACIIYTSGTGGAPKGVMLHHGAVLHNCEGAIDAFAALDLSREVFLSFLPLSHAYEHTCGQFLPIAIGAQIYYAEGADTLPVNFQEARPTIVMAVPRLCEVFHQRIGRSLRKAGRLQQGLFRRAVELGVRRQTASASLSLGERLVDAVLERLVRNTIRKGFGGRLKALLSGGAALNPDIGVSLAALGLPIFQGYGQTEAAPLISVNRPNRVRMNTVGPPIKGTEVRLAADSEILVRGEGVMQGYWRNEEATRMALRDGWLHTGDVGEIDADGCLRITDRKKDIIVNSGGDNVSPARIEGMLTLRREIAQAMVHGDQRPHLVALLVPDPEWMRTWARAAGKPPKLSVLAGDREFHRALVEVVDQVNAQLSIIERIRKFAVATEPFTVENEQLTPTLKIRRHVIARVYVEVLHSLYR